jgi:hypothetical protein
MIAPVVFAGLALAVFAGVRLRRAWRRRSEQAMVVTTWPEIEFSQMYGGWDAEAYDAGTGHDRSPRLAMVSLTPGRCLASRPGRSG